MLPDPLSAMVEKELRTLSRTPRFRLVFIMGFTFGILVWLPATLGGSRDNPFVHHFLTFVSVYALLLLGQVSFWNSFGFDRHAALLYYAVPVRVSLSLVAKNIAAGLFVLLEIIAVTAACLLLRLTLTPVRVLEAFAVTAILGLYLFAGGNLASVYLPRAMNPERVGRGGSSGFSQALVVLIFPVAGFPLLLAYLGRYAFESDFVFIGLLGFAAVLGVIVYWIAMDSAVVAANRRREQIVGELSRSEGPVTIS
jgi:ABC-2 type transport system permease protein